MPEGHPEHSDHDAGQESRSEKAAAREQEAQSGRDLGDPDAKADRGANADRLEGARHDLGIRSRAEFERGLPGGIAGTIQTIHFRHLATQRRYE
jgi:hypothetical protein